ncbi:3997_t:CDS:1 [Funneliformis geosporum]|uniref:9733_t:CDS:1 n=1 Tax=Funneliformis geosporum TaxID=1117311 RepID=A0A9W4WY25_9GLOM|nr:9733_t:CDS:1 [Funneliformis geosporum]CAI2179336.1 3997_t:CDS:1 [Funneliformis geosporum]
MYRKDMMKHKPHNMPMTKYSKLVSEWWKKLSADEKAKLQRQYQIDRDQKLQKVVSARDIAETREEIECENSRYQDEANILPKGMKKDCYFTESPTENFEI